MIEPSIKKKFIYGGKSRTPRVQKLATFGKNTMIHVADSHKKELSLPLDRVSASSNSAMRGISGQVFNGLNLQFHDHLQSLNYNQKLTN
jgi:hypothetical protein